MPDLRDDDDDELMDLLNATRTAADAGEISAILEGAESESGVAEPGPEDFETAGAQTGLDEDVLSALLSDAPVRTTAPAPKDTASSVMADQEGQQAPFGVRDQRQDLTGNASRVAELYGQLEPEQQAGPGRRERELNASFGSSDAEIQKAMRAAAIMKALFDDDGGYGERAKYLIEREKEHAGRLSSARAADAAEAAQNRRVDQATAEMLVLAGVSPEAAVKARMGDPIVQLVRSTGGLGVKLRNQDTQVLNKNVGETGDVWQTLTEEQGKNERQDKQLANNVEVAKLRKRSGSGGGVAGDKSALEAAFLERQENAPAAKVAAFLGGTLDVNDPLYARLKSAQAIYQAVPASKRAQVLTGMLGREAGVTDAPDRAAAVKQADPEAKRKARDDLDATGRPLQRALKGWESLPPKVQAWAAKTGLEGAMGQIKQLGLTDAQAVEFARVIKQVNEDIKRTAGAAVSDSEWVRKGAEIGITGKGISAVSPAILGAWLRDGWSDWKARKRSAEEVYGPLWGSGAP